MNLGHSALTDWGLSGVSIGPGDTILDAGCGGGRTVSKLARAATAGKVYGIDFSEASVAAARRFNARAEEKGRVEIRHASVSHLPFADETFDLVTAVETHFFWPDLPADVREVRRVLKSGGTFLLVAEVYLGGKKWSEAQIENMVDLTGMHLLTADEHREVLAQGGYSDVQVREEPEKGWICVSAKKP
jgi:ubiquinone/menaquinone biosynthesis C-methylase UbiE